MPKHRPVVIDRTGRDIHAEAARIRVRGPVAQVELPGGVLAWSITGYHEARQALVDHRFSKDPRRHWPAFAEGQIGADFPLIGWVLMENLTTTHGEDHSRLRRLTAKAFTPRRVEAMRPTVERVVVDLLDDLAAAMPGEVVDLKARFAQPLAARVICDLIGVPAADRAEILLGGEANVDTTRSAAQTAASVDRVHRLMRELVAAKRRRPADDLTSDLIAAREEDGSRLSEIELVGTLLLLIATGTEPVTNLVTNAVLALLTHPDQLALVRAGHVTWSDVIEETLRAEAPVAHLPFRFAVTDIEIGGVTIARGDPVLLGFAAVGRDPAVHGADADRFDLTRANKEHLSFGYGVYRCVGMPLARVEAMAALTGLFGRFGELALAVAPDQVAPQGTFIMNGRRALPAYLTAPANARPDRTG